MVVADCLQNRGKTRQWAKTCRKVSQFSGWHGNPMEVNGMRKSTVLYLATVLLFHVLMYPHGTASAGFPEKPIRFIVTWPAGGSSDQLGRSLSKAVEKHLGQPVIVENRSGGATMVGTAYLARQKPDGYVIALLSTSFIRNSLMVKVPFDPVNDLAAIMRVGDNLNGIVVRADSPFKTIKDLVDYGKANPGKITYGTSGVGAASHIGIEALTQQLGVEWQHVPFKGSAAAVTTILGGHVDFVATTSVWAPHVQAGSLRLLAIYGTRRSSKFPDTPTLLESGYDVVCETTEAVMGPAGMPEDIKMKLHDAYKAALDDPDVRTVMENLNMEVNYQTGPDYDRAIRETYAENDLILKKIGLYRQD